MTIKNAPSDIRDRRVYFGTTEVRYRQNDDERVEYDAIIDRPFIKTSTVVYLTLCALVFGYVLYQMLLTVPL